MTWCALGARLAPSLPLGKAHSSNRPFRRAHPSWEAQVWRAELAFLELSCQSLEAGYLEHITFCAGHSSPEQPKLSQGIPD